MDDATTIPPDMKAAIEAARARTSSWSSSKQELAARITGQPVSDLKDGKVRPHAEHRIRPHRVEMLAKGIDLTWGDRDKEYGDPLTNGACAAELKAVLRKYAALSPRTIHPAEQEFLEMNLTKVARIVTGPQVKEDSYIDGGVYMCMAGEAALRSGE